MQFLTDTKIPFLKYRKVAVWLSAVLLVVAAVELFGFVGLNLGIDFAGGTQMTVIFRENIEIDQLRRDLEDAAIDQSQIQRIGQAGGQEVLIKVPVRADSEEGSAAPLIAALDQTYNAGAPEGAFDLNQRGTDSLAGLLTEADPEGRLDAEAGALAESDAREHYEDVAERVIAVRNDLKVFSSWDQVRGAEGVAPEVLSFLEANAHLGAFNVLSTENVGPQIGSELRRKGILAVTLSMLGMLAYIWYRFELRFGIGALVATFHDLLITLGLYSLMGYEFNLPTIAAFLTLVGYSVNDTVIIFDRVRENMRRFRRLPLEEVMNISVNQTLSRTILTSGTTLLAVTCLFVLGGDVVRGFAFVLLVGVIVGTYSSVFVASPFALLWEEWFGRDAREARSGARRTSAKPSKAG